MAVAQDPIEVLTTLAQSLGLSSQEVIEAAAALDGTSTVPTVAEWVEPAIGACPEKSLPTYRVHFHRLADAYGERRLDQVDLDDLTQLRDEIRKRAAVDKIERAKATGRRLASYEEDAHGHGAAENFVRAARFFFRHAVTKKVLRTSPAIELKAPKRPPAPERPLTAAELEEFALVATTTGNDPELDGLLFEFHRKTAARREGALNLRLTNLDRHAGAVSVTEKLGKTRQVPLDIDCIDRLEAFARRRGAAQPHDNVFRSRHNQPISRKRYNVIADRLDEYTTWSEPLDVGIHWIRHTTLDDIRAVSDPRVASAYAGHADDAIGTIGLYNKVTFEERCAAFEALFGPRYNR